MRILAIESSTTSAKAMLYDSKDGVVGMLSEPYSEGIEQGATGAQDPAGPGIPSLPWTRRKRR